MWPHTSAALCITAKRILQCPFGVKSGRDALKFRCPLYPRKRTSLSATRTSALDHLQTHALQHGRVKRPPRGGLKARDIFEHHRQVHFTYPPAVGDAPYCPVARIACAVSVPLASAASTVPISRPAYSASPEKKTAPASGFRSAACASRVLGVA
jgi:hypothetical protein